MADLPPPPGNLGDLPPPPGGLGDLPPPPGGLGDLPPPPGDLPRPPGDLGDLPPPPGDLGDLPPPPGDLGDLPPPPISTGLPPPPASSGLPPPPMSTGLPPPPTSTGLPPPPMSTGLPPPPTSTGLPPPPMSTGLPPPPTSTGLPPPPTSTGLPPPPMSTGLPPPPRTSGLPPPPSSSGLPPPPMSTGLPPPPMSSGLPPPPMSTGLPPPPNSALIPPKEFAASKASTRSVSRALKDDEIETTLLKTCAICRQPCKSTFYFTNGQYYHADCFKCQADGCGQKLRPPNYVLYKGKLLCSKHGRFNGDLKKCPICNLYLFDIDNPIQPKGYDKLIHPGCFYCYECCKLLDPKGKFTIIEGNIVCDSCKNIVKNRVCCSCSKPILGRYVKNRGKYFHIDHFTCEKKGCNKVLYGKNYVVHHNKYYCPEHGTIYKKRCAYCKGEFSPLENDTIEWNGKNYHERCFVCRVCSDHLDPETCYSVHGRPYCQACFDRRVKEGDVDEHGRTIKKKDDSQHKHKLDVSLERRERFAQILGKEIPMPVYKKDLHKHHRRNPE